MSTTRPTLLQLQHRANFARAAARNAEALGATDLAADWRHRARLAQDAYSEALAAGRTR